MRPWPRSHIPGANRWQRWPIDVINRKNDACAPQSRSSISSGPGRVGVVDQVVDVEPESSDVIVDHSWRVDVGKVSGHNLDPDTVAVAQRVH